jgi:hypothetical protein
MTGDVANQFDGMDEWEASDTELRAIEEHFETCSPDCACFICHCL